MSYTQIKPEKSTVAALLLTFLFGPLGLFYASITGGLIMTLVAPVIILALLYIDITTTNFLSSLSIGMSVIGICCIYYPVCMIWAVNAVSRYNRSVFVNLPATTIVVNSDDSSNENNEVMAWLKENPGKSLNDYYSNGNKSRSSTLITLLVLIGISVLVVGAKWLITDRTEIVEASTRGNVDMTSETVQERRKSVVKKRRQLPSYVYQDEKSSSQYDNRNSQVKYTQPKYTGFTKEELQNMAIVRISIPIFQTTICEYLGINEELFEKWNPDYDQFWVGDYPSEYYSLRIPKDKLDLFIQKKEELIEQSSEICSH